jgi:hypothetical protein
MTQPHQKVHGSIKKIVALSSLFLASDTITALASCCFRMRSHAGRCGNQKQNRFTLAVENTKYCYTRKVHSTTTAITSKLACQLTHTPAIIDEFKDKVIANIEYITSHTLSLSICLSVRKWLGLRTLHGNEKFLDLRW